MLRNASTSRGAYVCLLLSLVSSNAATAAAEAERGPPRALTLAQAIEHALAHRPRILAAHRRIAAAGADAATPRARWLPRVGAVAQLLGSTMNNSTASFLSARSLDIPRVGATVVHGDVSGRPHPSTLVGAGVRQTVFDFGRIAAEAAAMDRQTDVARWGLRAAELEVSLGVADAFYAVSAAARVEVASRAAVARAEARRAFTEAAVQTGLRPPSDLARARADEARLRAGALRAEAGVRVARTLFAAAVGLEGGQLDALEESSEDPAVPELGALLEVERDRNPALGAARAALEAQQARTSALAAALRPELLASAGVTARAGGAPPANDAEAVFGGGWLPAVPNWHLGVVLRWPLLDPALAAEADASRAREAVLASEAAELELRELAATEAAHHELELAEATVAAAAQAVEAARESQRQAAARFREGLGTTIEVSDAEAQLVEVEIELALARFQVARARARLLRSWPRAEEGTTP